MTIILNIGSLKISSWIVRWRQHTLSGLGCLLWKIPIHLHYVKLNIEITQLINIIYSALSGGVSVVNTINFTTDLCCIQVLD